VNGMQLEVVRGQAKLFDLFDKTETTIKDTTDKISKIKKIDNILDILSTPKVLKIQIKIKIDNTE
jgi:hypothetical protein